MAQIKEESFGQEPQERTTKSQDRLETIGGIPCSRTEENWWITCDQNKGWFYLAYHYIPIMKISTNLNQFVLFCYFIKVKK